MATETGAAVSRETLEDRWRGLMCSRKDPISPSGLQDELDEVLRRLIVGATRNRFGPEQDVPWIDDLEGIIRDEILRRAEESGAAR